MRDAADVSSGQARRSRGRADLEVEALTLVIDGKTLVDRISVISQRDAITVIMGPNGAGKSLLLRLLHGLIAPTSGRVRWDGAELCAEMQRRQAMVFQRPVLLRRSVGANIDFALGLRRAKTSERRDALLTHVGLIDRANQPARLLSGGEQQRLALARALATDPDVLFLDEPTASLDPAATLAIEQIVSDAHAAGTKIVFVTHDRDQARRLAGEILFLHHGRLAEYAPADRFFERPDSEAARAYLDGRIVL